MEIYLACYFNTQLVLFYFSIHVNGCKLNEARGFDLKWNSDIQYVAKVAGVSVGSLTLKKKKKKNGWCQDVSNSYSALSLQGSD